MNYQRGRGRNGSYFRGNRSTGPSYQTRDPYASDRGTKRGLSHSSKACSGITLSLDLDPNGVIFLQELKNMWNMLKKSAPVVTKLHQYFSTCINPYEQTLRLLYNCQDFNNAKSKTLPFFIIEEFKSWATVNKERIRHLLTTDLMLNAFKIISLQHTLNLTKLVVEIFEMDKNGDLFIDIIKSMIETKNYREACQSSLLLKLQDRFSVEDFLLPLVLQDKHFGLDEFLASSPRHQVELVCLLDSVLGKSSIRDALSSYALNLKIPDVRWEKLYAKPLKKLLTKLTKTFKLSDDLTPNLNRRRNEGALQFLLHKRYIDNSFGNESWREMVQEAVGEDKDLQKELISQVAMYNDSPEALWWAIFYKIDKEHWPYNVKLYEENPHQKTSHQPTTAAQEEDNWNTDDVQIADQPIEYHKFPLPLRCIHLVDSEELLVQFLESGLEKVDIVGIDCEWKPNFNSQQNELALMQIATRENVFILDIIKIGTKTPQIWRQLGKLLFNNCDILKLGFGFTSDILMMKQSLPDLSFSPKQIGFLDLLSLWKIIDKYPKVALPFEGPSSGPSLGSLVFQCFGRSLDKSDQFSNWEKRPLRDSQLIYAALDAYCLIQVHDVIKECCEKSEFPFEETCYNLMTNEKAPKKKIKKVAQKKESTKGKEEDIAQPPSPHLNPVQPSMLKVVCDTMLQGLGKNLRRCGIDAAILENNMEHMECVRYSQDEHRYILTKGTVFNRLCGCVPTGHCLKIISDNVDEQLKQVIDYYKVNVGVDNVFSVCQACNGRSFIKVTKSTMLEIKKNATSKRFHSEDYDDFDEPSGFSSDDDHFEPGLPINQVKKSNLHNDDKVNLVTGETSRRAKIQVAAVPDGVLEKMECFYVCEDCGKIYWDGTHLERVLSGRLQGIVQ